MRPRPPPPIRLPSSALAADQLAISLYWRTRFVRVCFVCSLGDVAANKNPAYKGGFTVKQNHSAYYFTRTIIKPDIVRALGLTERNDRGAPKLPKMLEWQQHQLARVMARAVQMDRRVSAILNISRAR
jgi:hypothetical protein